MIKMKYAYFNGKIIPEEKVKIHFNDLGFARGYGVFDAMKTVQRRPFLLREHFKRLQNSAQTLKINFSMTLIEFVTIIDKLLKVNQKFKQNRELAIRTTVTGGVSANALKMDGPATVLITINDLDLVTPGQDLYKNGGKIILVDFQRVLPKIKTTSYLTAILYQDDKEKAKATEIVYHHNGLLLEGATSNIFLVKNKTVITPAKNILEGITRNFIIKLLKEKQIKIEVRSVELTELFTADEVFLTGTFKNILPIVQIDDKIVNKGEVGQMTKMIMDYFG